MDSESDDGDDNADDKLRKDSKGDQYVLLSDKRRVTVRAFKKSILIDIREVSPSGVSSPADASDANTRCFPDV